MVSFAPHSSVIKFNAFPYLLFRGRKQTTSNGWRASLGVLEVLQ